MSNPHGWGIGYHAEGGVHCEREVDPAATDEDFREHATEVDARTAIAHIRRATVGEPAVENTHPFLFDDSMLAHNGHIPNFDSVRPLMLEAMTPAHRDAIDGSTDSEHFFHLVLTNQLQIKHAQRPERSMGDVLAESIVQVLDWCDQVGVDEPPALNFLWTDGDRLAGSRFGRTLWWVPTEGIRECPVCGKTHAPADAGNAYHSVEFASERITNEDWRPANDESVFEVTRDCSVDFVSL